MIYEDEDGSVRLLPGYKFDPTDEILVNFYLRRRVFHQPLPVQIIPDFDVFQTEPWDLLGGDGKIFNERKCFFLNTIGRDLENLDIRVTGNGQLRVIEKGKDVPIPRNNEVIGKRNALNFWEVQGGCYMRTKRVMHEFRLALIANSSKCFSHLQREHAGEVETERRNAGENKQHPFLQLLITQHSNSKLLPDLQGSKATANISSVQPISTWWFCHVLEEFRLGGISGGIWPIDEESF
ncbi:NAC domain-containing protein 83-like [Lotus japonicus]|uniref:NAC domain-containing protein 83-like n=1 Tax=Lotus japonicus TaxID=34305 RepID=UPI00258C0BE7|nr:NAC domain-containing protein 83-like [Lotus japonicus]